MEFSSLKLTFGFMFLIIGTCSGAPPNSRGPVAPQALFQGPQLYLTVSAIAGFRQEGDDTVLLDRMFEINWENFERSSGDMIGIYNADPSGMDAQSLKTLALEEHPVLEGSGNIKSSVRYERRELNPSSERCTGFWVAYLSDSRVIMSNCLEIHPTWMNDMRSVIRNVPMHSLMVPGSHNAGSWIHYAGRASEGPAVEYTYCHEDSIYDQLIHGIRALDIRVGHYPLTVEKFFINHDVIVVRPLRTLLEDVRRFILETNEIVLLDFHRFPVGMGNEENHHKLIAFLEEHLGDLLAPESLSVSVTPEQLWQLNRTAIAFYSNSIQSEYDFLWPGVQQAWGDVKNLEDLESYLTSAIPEHGCKRKAWSAMAQITSTAEDIIVRPSFGIRGYSNITNNELSKWYQRESWYSKSMIVALDFYRGTNVIETAIEVNKNMANTCV